MVDKNIDTSFPFIKAENYNDQVEIANAFPHLKNVNQNSFDYENIKNARCFVIRSNTDDDVHKAIKYGIWTSTYKNSQKLSQAFIDCEKEGTSVFLFFSVVKSGQFEGIAKLTSSLQQINFPYWWQQGKWKSLFTIEWIYIKDVAYKHLDGIFNIEDMIITRSRDGTEVTWDDNGKKIFKIFAEMDSNESIFKDFAELDEREQSLRDQQFAPQKFNKQSGYSNDMAYMQQQQMQMMYMWMQQQMMWQQQMLYQQPQFMQQQLPQFQNYNQQQQQQQQVTTPYQTTDMNTINPGIQAYQQQEQTQQYQNQ